MPILSRLTVVPLENSQPDGFRGPAALFIHPRVVVDLYESGTGVPSAQVEVDLLGTPLRIPSPDISAALSNPPLFVSSDVGALVAKLAVNQLTTRSRFLKLPIPFSSVAWIDVRIRLIAIEYSVCRKSTAPPPCMSAVGKPRDLQQGACATSLQNGDNAAKKNIADQKAALISELNAGLWYFNAPVESTFRHDRSQTTPLSHAMLEKLGFPVGSVKWAGGTPDGAALASPSDADSQCGESYDAEWDEVEESWQSSEASFFERPPSSVPARNTPLS